jgi:hypothetical protein
MSYSLAHVFFCSTVLYTWRTPTDPSEETFFKSQIKLKIDKNNLFPRYHMVNSLWWHPHNQLPPVAFITCYTQGPSCTENCASRLIFSCGARKNWFRIGNKADVSAELWWRGIGQLLELRGVFIRLSSVPCSLSKAFLALYLFCKYIYANLQDVENWNKKQAHFNLHTLKLHWNHLETPPHCKLTGLTANPETVVLVKQQHSSGRDTEFNRIDSCSINRKLAFKQAWQTATCKLRVQTAATTGLTAAR